MAKLILGLAGEMGSGKGTVAKYIIDKYQGNSHRFSTVLRNILDRLYLLQSRENMQELSTLLRQKFGEDILAKVMYQDVLLDKNEIITIDGVRRMADIKYLREIPHFKLIFIEADIEKRYERIHKRTENSNDQTISFEEFVEEQKQEAESQVRELKSQANYLINNNGSFESLYTQVDEIIYPFK